MKKNNKGFSLVELIIVIAIMAVLIGLLAPQYLKFVQKSKVSADLTNAQALATAYNAAFAEGSVVTGTYNQGSQGACSVSWPDVKADTTKSAGDWNVYINADGVSAVTIDSTILYPTPASGSTWAAN